MDFAEARYFASNQGRFTSVDPLAASARTGNPQTFNRYSYALNSPLKYTDPSGMSPGGNANPHSGAGRVQTYADDLTQEQFNRGLRDYIFQRASQGFLNDTADYTTSMYTVSFPEPQNTAPQYDSNSTMIVIWEPGYNPFGHVSYITMQNDISYSWEGVADWTEDYPSSDYTNRRSTGTMGSTGMGYIMDFGSLNKKFQKVLRGAYDGVLGIRPPYGPVTNNCAKAGILAINSIRKGLQARDNVALPKLLDIRPSAVKAYIENNLMGYVVGQQRFPYH